MAVKTITIDLRAYEALRRHKRQGQSFSDVIKEHFSRGATSAEFLRALEDLELDDSTLDAIDGLVAARERSSASFPEL